MLEFFEQDELSGFVSIYERHMTLNSQFLKYLEDCLKVRVGFDTDENLIYIFLLDADMASSGEYNKSSLLSIKLAKTYARISSKPLIDTIRQKFNIKIEKDSYKQYKATYNEAKKCIIINVGGEL